MAPTLPLRPRNFLIDNKKNLEYEWAGYCICICVFILICICICIFCDLCFVIWIEEGSGACPRCGRHADFIGECGGTNERLEIHSLQCLLIGRFYDANYLLNHSLFVQLSASHINALIILSEPAQWGLNFLFTSGIYVVIVRVGIIGSL